MFIRDELADNRTKIKMEWLKNGVLIVLGIFLTLSLYHLILQFALSVSWVSFIDLDDLDALARGQLGFEVAFTALQFTILLGILLWVSSRQFGDNSGAGGTVTIDISTMKV